MAGRFGATVVIDRPIEEVFAFLADGENDPKFSSRVLEIAKRTDGPPGVGTVYASTVKDAGMKTKREFELTEFEAPSEDSLGGDLQEPGHGPRRRLRPVSGRRRNERDLLQCARGARPGSADRRIGVALCAQGGGRVCSGDQGGGRGELTACCRLRF